LEAAKMMRTFNKIFCSDRITIERAFGQFVRHYPSLWGAIPRFTVSEIQLFVQVLAKLHNLCVDEFLCKRFGYSEGVLNEERETLLSYPTPNMPKTYTDFCSKMPSRGWRRHVDNDEDEYDNSLIAEITDDVLLTGGDALRRGVASEPHPERQFTLDNATLNAGMAMSSDLDEHGHLPCNDRFRSARENRRIQEVIEVDRRHDEANLNSLQDFINRHEMNVRQTLNGNLSATRRLQMSLNMYDRGLRFGDSESLREQRKC